MAASVSIAPTATNVCAGTNVTFTATPTNGGAAPSYQWKLNGGNVGTNSATYSNNALANGNTVTCVMTSNADCVTGNPATSNTITMTVNPSVAASVNIAPTATNICAGTNVTFTATPTNGGTTPSYQWKLNGVNVGTNSPTYSNNALTNLVPVTCVMTSNAACVTGSPATSNSVAIVVNPSVAASVSIAPTATNVCAGTNVTFTATPTNGGAAPSYQWKLNGNNVGTNSSTYSNNTLANGNTVSCVMTSNAACVTGSPATSNTITMTVNPSVAASVSIAPTATNVCAGTNVTFTATPINGGAAPNYQWKLNGNNVGTNSSTYSNNTLANGNLVSCVMTSNAACVTGSPATSNTINMTVNTNLTPTVAISANANPICPGTNVTFTATPSNGGTTPSYQWKLNGNNVGTNSATYSNAALATGNTVSCVMTSNASCLTSSTATSNVITMQVTANPPASVTIAPTATNICAGTNVTFTATPINGGTPSYQWKLNGNNVGTNSATYSNNALTNGNTVTCIMTSSLSCVTGSPATSNTITMTVNPNVAASVSIVPTATNVCSGTNVTFTATPTNGGTTPSYQWKLNGANVGTNSPTYSNNALANLVPVTCVMTSNAACVTGSPANSNSVAIIVNPSVAASVSIAPTATNVCAGTNVTFTATPTNGGAAPSYQWKLNGGNVGTNSATYSNNALANGNTVSCVMTSNAACVTGSPATSNTITMTVNPNVAASVSIVPTATNVCSGTNVTFTATPTNGGTTPSYQWKLNGVNVGTNIATYSNNALANGNTVSCVMTSNAACVTGSPATSNTINMTVNPNPVPIISQTVNNLNSSAAASYQWNLNGNPIALNGTSQQYTALVNGNYSVTVVDANGCSGTSAVLNVTVSGIFQPVQFQKIEIFPNPNNGLMKMVIETPKGGEITLQIIDILGKLVSEKIVNINQGRNEFALDLSELSQNIYFIKTKLNDLNYQGKIIIAE
ncbi:MAG: T9SS type A sorting domain-containing protein [Bacteroidetes bacterium]|nr:T9SS type A sorting domain-containing protein [Bacteroidota bacterium]